MFVQTALQLKNTDADEKIKIILADSYFSIVSVYNFSNKD